MAIIVPDEPVVRKWAVRRSITSQDQNYEDLLNSKDLHTELLSRLTIKQKEKNFNGLEIPKRIFCTSTEFTVENDTLTPSMKLKRAEAKKMYYEQIKEMYDFAKL